MKLEEAVEEIKTKSKKRKFIQSIDLVMNFHKIDFSKPDNRINVTVRLPKGKGKSTKTVAIVADELIVEAKKVADRVITKDELEALGKDKKQAKKIANEFDTFLCQTNLMPLVGKNLGQVLGPRGKMPRPIPPTGKIEPIIKSMEGTITIKQKGKFLPTIHVMIGTKEMSKEDLIENANSVISAIVEKLPNREGNIKSLFVKTTMGKAVKVDLK